MTSIFHNKLIFECYCWFSLLWIFESYKYGRPVLFVLQTILAASACLWDWYISPTMRHNVDRIVSRDLVPSQFQVLLDMYLTILTSQSIAVGLALWSGCFLSDVKPHYDFRLFKNMFLYITCNEIVFATTHRYLLHGTTWGGRIHEIHHTCQPSSYSTAFIFHFFDSNIEFTFSFVTMTIFANSGLLGTKDPYAVQQAMHLAYVWYTVGGHSENIKLGHFWHHHYVNSNFTAYYTNVRMFWPTPKTDFVRRRLFQKSKQDRQQQHQRPQQQPKQE